MGAEVGQFGAQGVGAGEVGAAAAGEEQVPYTVLGHQMPGQLRAQQAGPTGDQHRTGRRPFHGRFPGCRRRRRPHQSRHPDHAVAQRDLGLVQGRGRRQRTQGRGGAVGVDDREPAGILRLCRPDRTPDRRRAEVDRPVRGVHGHGAARHDHQPGRRAPVIVQPGTHCGQHFMDRSPHPDRHGRILARGRHGEGDHLRHRPTVARLLPLGQRHRRRNRRARGGTRPVRAGQRPPLDAVQGQRRAAQLLSRHGTQGQGAHGRHGLAVPVGDLQGCLGGSGPGEGDPGLLITVGRTVAVQEVRQVERRIQQRRMDSVLARVEGLLGQCDLSQDSPVVPPGPPYAPEHRSVVVPLAGQLLVQGLHRNGGGVRRRPGGGVLRERHCLVRPRGGQDAHRVPGPRGSRVVRVP